VSLDPPKWTFGLFGRLHFGSLGGAASSVLTFLHVLQPSKLSFQSNLQCRVASIWALPRISSFSWLY